MKTIASDNTMSYEIMGALKNRKNGMKLMQQRAKMMMESQSSWMAMAKHNPAIMNNMMSNMRETAKIDTCIISGTIKAMKENQPMMRMMQKMTGSKGVIVMDRKREMGN
jgi:hypothetical protein